MHTSPFACFWNSTGGDGRKRMLFAAVHPVRLIARANPIVSLRCVFSGSRTRERLRRRLRPVVFPGAGYTSVPNSDSRATNAELAQASHPWNGYTVLRSATGIDNVTCRSLPKAIRYSPIAHAPPISLLRCLPKYTADFRILQRGSKLWARLFFVTSLKEAVWQRQSANSLMN